MGDVESGERPFLTCSGVLLPSDSGRKVDTKQRGIPGPTAPVGVSLGPSSTTITSL